MSSEGEGSNTRLNDQFGRFLIYLLDPARSHTVHEFVLAQLASTPKLYAILSQRLSLCRQLLHQMSALYACFCATSTGAEGDAALTAGLRDSVLEAILHLVSNRAVRQQLVDEEQSCLVRDAAKFR